MTEREYTKKWMELALTLVINGVDIKVEEPTTLFGKQIYKIIVPEKHELIEDYSPEAFMKEIKEEISELVYEICEAKTEEEKEDAREYFKVLGKVKNETWTQDKYDQKKEEVLKEVKVLEKYTGYKEI